MPTGELGRSDDMLTALPQGTQESGAGGLQVDARTGGSNEQNAPFATSDEAWPRGRHGVRQGQGKKYGVRREFEGE